MFALKSLNAKLLAIYVPLVCASVLLYFGTLEYEEYREARAELVGSLDHLASVPGTSSAAVAGPFATAIAGLAGAFTLTAGRAGTLAARST